MKTIQRGVVYVICALILTVIVIVDIMFLWPVDVLKDWKLTVPQRVYHTADEVQITSTYVKTRDVKGDSRRFLSCNGDNYTINESRKGAAPGKRSALIYLIIPESTAKPATCTIRVEVVYRLPGGRKVIEKNHTNEFRLE